MGFNKRFITKETILSTSKERINTLFRADAFIFLDEWSSRFYELFDEGYGYNKIIEKLNKNEDN